MNNPLYELNMNWKFLTMFFSASCVAKIPLYIMVGKKAGEMLTAVAITNPGLFTGMFHAEGFTPHPPPLLKCG